MTKQATLRGRKARLHSAQFKSKRRSKNKAFEAEATFKKDLEIEPDYFLARNTSSNKWLLQENSKVTILNYTQIPGLQNQGSQNDISLGNSPVKLGSARNMQRPMTQEERAL